MGHCKIFAARHRRCHPCDGTVGARALGSNFKPAGAKLTISHHHYLENNLTPCPRLKSVLIRNELFRTPACSRLIIFTESLGSYICMYALLNPDAAVHEGRSS